jgi:hypothetical protein
MFGLTIVDIELITSGGLIGPTIGTDEFGPAFSP